MSNDITEKFDVALAVESETQATLPAQREFVIDRPGHINYAEQRGNYAGCKLMTFGIGVTENNVTIMPTALVNEYFRQHANLLVVGIWPFSDHIDVLYTNTLEGGELEEFNEYSRSVAIHMQEWRAKRAEREAVRTKAESDAMEETKRLIAKGKKCEVDHGGLKPAKQLLKGTGK